MLGLSLQAPEVRLGASEDEPSVLEQVLGEDSGTVSEGFSVPESPLHAMGSEFSSLPVVESCLGTSDVGHPANDGSSSEAEPTPPKSALTDSVVALPLGKDCEGRLGLRWGLLC